MERFPVPVCRSGENFSPSPCSAPPPLGRAMPGADATHFTYTLPSPLCTAATGTITAQSNKVTATTTTNHNLTTGDSVTIDAKKRLIQLNVSPKELAKRRKTWKAPAPRYTKGLLAKYRRLVSTASRGAITDSEA